MYSVYQDRGELEDELYQEDEGDSEGSEVNSELEFHLYSQLHYSSHAGEMEELGDRGEKEEGGDSRQLEAPERTVDVDGEQEKSGENKPSLTDLSKLMQHLNNIKEEKKTKKKKKGEKPDKQKKGNSNSKGQRSSSYFEEVIVIDSSPDVISISEDDTADDDEGVCTSKGRSSDRMQTSTPAQQGTQKRLSIPVTVHSSSSESDSEESSESDSSDSDALENWMILGRGNQDGDHSISLNVEGGFDSNEEAAGEGGSWLVSARDKEAGIYNKDKGARITPQRVSHRYFIDKSVHCKNCNKMGHLTKNCPKPKKLSPCFLCGTPGHLVSDCPNKYCNNCGMPGHLYNSCSERAYWHKRCNRCSMTGHLSDACPEIWRQYHLTTKKGTPTPVRQQRDGRTPVYCYNCSMKGHFGHACKQRRMFNGTYPSTTIINHYDSKKEIRRREKLIKSKVEELKKKGFFLTSYQTPLTPGPPKKKQKFNHHKSNYQFNHTPRQSPNNHKRSHIFFNDNDDFGAGATTSNKSNKYKQQGSTSHVKPWKPKRPVPTSKEPLPPTKLIVDEADDFPRGGGKGDDAQKKKKKRSKKKKTALPEGFRDSRPDRLFGTIPGEMQGLASKPQKGKRNQKSQVWRNAHKKHAAQMYPTDENLFIIKQRKGSR